MSIMPHDFRDQLIRDNKSVVGGTHGEEKGSQCSMRWLRDEERGGGLGKLSGMNLNVTTMA